MPHRPAKPCARPGCAALTHARYCPEHAKQAMRHYEKYQRDPLSRKRYDYRWSKIRAAYLAAHPLCELCQLCGRLTPAVLVHHKNPLAAGGTHDTENLQALCVTCHNAHHARDVSRWK